MEEKLKLAGSPAGEKAPAIPLCVDLDGTLVRTDTFAECLLLTIPAGPKTLAGVLLVLLRSRAACKQVTSRLVRLDPALLPYREDFLAFLHAERARGRRLLLVTGADDSIAQGVARHLGIFDDVLASDGSRNLTRGNKADAIAAYLDGEPFCYAGNSSADLPVWRRSQTAILVDTPKGYSRMVAEQGKLVEREFPREAGWRSLVRLMRPEQWAKNLLILVPLFLGHKLVDSALWGSAAAAFCAFSLCASALYVWNDLLDIQSDRAHARKRMRPLASGAVSFQAAGMLMAALVAGSVALSAVFLPPSTWGLLLAYAGSSICYSTLLKRLMMLDVVTLAALYTLRIFYGGAATGIKVSVWTMVFSVFLFLSLALIKRLTELRGTQTKVSTNLAGRGYQPEDLPILASLASAAGYLSALVLGLYIQSPEVQALYSRPQYLWFMMPALIYWISRALLLSNRGQMDDDPVLYALKDRASYVAGACCVAIVYLAS